MQEVLKGFVSEVPSVLKIEQLYAEIHGKNVRCYNLLTKLGFVFKQQLNNGVWHKQLTKMGDA